MEDTDAAARTVDWGEPRTKTTAWNDPIPPAELARELDGLEYLQGMIEGTIPAPPISHLLGMRFLSVQPGEAVFGLTPDESHYNPIGAVHGGVLCTILDSAAGCAVHSTLRKGWGYTSVEIKVSYLRGVTERSGDLRVRGFVRKSGRRIAFADAEITDAEGRLVATASSTLLIIEPSG